MHAGPMVFRCGPSPSEVKPCTSTLLWSTSRIDGRWAGQAANRNQRPQLIGHFSQAEALGDTFQQRATGCRVPPPPDLGHCWCRHGDADACHCGERAALQSPCCKSRTRAPAFRPAVPWLAGDVGWHGCVGGIWQNKTVAVRLNPIP